MTKEKIILTGDRPTGRLHIGHYVGSLRRRVGCKTPVYMTRYLSSLLMHKH